MSLLQVKIDSQSFFPPLGAKEVKLTPLYNFASSLSVP